MPTTPDQTMHVCGCGLGENFCERHRPKTKPHSRVVVGFSRCCAPIRYPPHTHTFAISWGFTHAKPVSRKVLILYRASCIKWNEPHTHTAQTGDVVAHHCRGRELRSLSSPLGFAVLTESGARMNAPLDCGRMCVENFGACKSVRRTRGPLIRGAHAVFRVRSI